MIGIIDYGTSNLKSVENALYNLNAEFIVCNDFKSIDNCSRLILPGVGDAGYAMSKINELDLGQIIKELNKPKLGICLGMQILCNYSQESDTKCLGIFNNNVKSFNSLNNNGLKVPHIGWNTLTELKSQLFKNVSIDSYVYFVHSYFADITEHTIAKTFYGGTFSSALNKDNFYGCQFHPEKSGDIGEQIIKNFLEII